ncbi:hypothetical protein K7432_007098 [Basidiobolus ranarum]|uniref:Inner membrane component domain-containing protein n=1 Tax=Basidiobolus ranarum TaxID=34480 RepID=A0ABR2WTV4_9FUNG
MSKTPFRSKDNRHTLESTATPSSVRTFYTARTSISPSTVSYSLSPTTVSTPSQNLFQMDSASDGNNRLSSHERQDQGTPIEQQSQPQETAHMQPPPQDQENVSAEQQRTSAAATTNTVIDIPGTQSSNPPTMTTPSKGSLRRLASKNSLHNRKSRSRGTSRRNSFTSSSSSSHEAADYRRHSRQSSQRRGHKAKYRHSSSDEEGDGRYEVKSDEDNDDDSDDSDREMTLKDRQEAINTSHPFGLPLWKPALYKKSRSVTRSAYFALHSIPSPTGELFLYPGNILWTLLFGWWLALICLVVSVFLSFTPYGGKDYARVLRGLAWYLFWPFGRYVEGIEDIPAGVTRQHLDSHFLDLAWTNSIRVVVFIHVHALPLFHRFMHILMMRLKTVTLFKVVPSARPKLPHGLN